MYTLVNIEAVIDASIYRHVTTSNLLCWQRVLVANVLATSGETWTLNFMKFHSGTYNNQYMVVDTKRFIPGIGP